jgi:hypothetical protein
MRADKYAYEGAHQIRYPISDPHHAYKQQKIEVTCRSNIYDSGTSLRAEINEWQLSTAFRP